MSLFEPISKILRPARFDEAARAADAWASNQRALDEAIFWVRCAKLALLRSDLSEKDRGLMELTLAREAQMWRTHIMLNSTVEEKMETLGVPFDRRLPVPLERKGEAS